MYAISDFVRADWDVKMRVVNSVCKGMKALTHRSLRYRFPLLGIILVPRLISIRPSRLGPARMLSSSSPSFSLTLLILSSGGHPVGGKNLLESPAEVGVALDSENVRFPLARPRFRPFEGRAAEMLTASVDVEAPREDAGSIGGRGPALGVE